MLSVLPKFCGRSVTVDVTVTDVASDALLPLLTELADIPMVIFADSITKDINVH
jgi:hypothetical protein